MGHNLQEINFIFQGDMVHDGLWAALKLLENDYTINYNGKGKADFTLGWGGFHSEVDEYVRGQAGPKGLCIGGNAYPPKNILDYDVLFYETEWYRPAIASHPNIVHAFGINADIFKPSKDKTKFFDWLGVGAFATWKRWDKMTFRKGRRLVIGHYQLNNEDESIEIVKTLLRGGVMVSPSIPSEKLVDLYHLSKMVYIPANIMGGGERAVWEARASGCNVVVEEDNPKLLELTTNEVKDHFYYYKQLKKGIKSCLK